MKKSAVTLISLALVFAGAASAKSSSFTTKPAAGAESFGIWAESFGIWAETITEQGSAVTPAVKAESFGIWAEW